MTSGEQVQETWRQVERYKAFGGSIQSMMPQQQTATHYVPSGELTFCNGKSPCY